MAFVSGSTRTFQTGQTVSNVTVPSGTAAGYIVVVDFWCQWASGTITPPAGFTLHTSVTLSGSSRFSTIYRYWKRLTAADTGTYAFTTTSTSTMAIATMWSGRKATGSPFDPVTATASAPAGVNTNVNCPDLAVTPNVAGADLLYAVAVWNGGLAANTVTQSFTDAVRNGTDGMLTAYKANQPASSSGNVSTSGSNNWVTLLSALAPANSPNPTAYLSTMTAVADAELTVDVKGSSTSHVYVGLRTDGAFTPSGQPENGYFLDLYGSGTTFAVKRNNGGVTTTLATPSLTEQVGQTLHIRFRTLGAVISVSAWYGASEPGSWTYTGTDGSPYSTAGKVSLGVSGQQATFNKLVLRSAS